MDDVRPAAGDRPRIWDHEEPRRFVADYIAWAKPSQPGFSHRRLARFAGFGSPSYVRAYLDGRRNFRADTADRFARALGLDDAERAYFVALVALDQAGTPEERDTLKLELLKLSIRHGQTATLDAARLDYFTHWFVPVIHAMACLKGFRASPHWIAARLRPRIRSYDAKLALDVLLELGLLVKDDLGIHVGERRLATDPALASSLIAAYLRRMVRMSEQAGEFWPREKRVNSGMTVTVPERILPDVLTRIEAFRRDLFDYIMAEQQNDEAINGQVVHIGFQAFQLTDVDGEP